MALQHEEQFLVSRRIVSVVFVDEDVTRRAGGPHRGPEGRDAQVMADRSVVGPGVAELIDLIQVGDCVAGHGPAPSRGERCLERYGPSRTVGVRKVAGTAGHSPCQSRSSAVARRVSVPRVRLPTRLLGLPRPTGYRGAR